jgi:uncharacterized protein (PEP-CTERM system associated)
VFHEVRIVGIRRRLPFEASFGAWGVASLLALAPFTGAAQEAGPGEPSLSIVPRVSVSERYTNNVSLSSTAQKSELVTTISPGISLRSNAGRLKGFFDYSLNEIVYARGSSGRQSQNALNSSLQLEAVDGFAFVDFSGSISQQSISALGTTSTDGSSLNGNSTETSFVRLSPYLRGNLAGMANYEVRYGWSRTSSAAANTSDIRTTDTSVQLDGAVRGGPLGWSAGWTSQDVKYSLGRTIESDRLNGTLTYAFNPQVSASLLISRESNNYTTAVKESHGSAGLGLNWRLSERTAIAAQIENRSFGQSHNISITHRTARTAWRFSDSRDVANSPAQSGVTTLGALSDLLYSQFASLESDPLKRAEMVNRFMQANGLSADAQVISNFLASTVSLQRRQEASFALLGVRDTITFVMNRGSNSTLGSFVTTFDDLSTNSVVHQSGFSVLYSHRLTPDASMNVVASRQSTSGSGGAGGTSLRALDVSLSGRLGRNMSASVGARRVFFDSATNPYTETAVTGNLNVQF